MKYKLGDLTVKHWNSWDHVPRDPATVGAAIYSALGISGGTTALFGIAGLTGQAIVGYLVTTAITSWAMAALAPKPDFGAANSAGILVNSRDAAAPHDFVYGEIRKGGTVTFYESTGDSNRYLHQVIVLAGHELNSIGDIYINDQVASIDGNGFVTSAGSGDDQVDYNSKIRIKKHKGDQTTADSDLVSETSVDSNFVGNGIAYLYVRYEYDQDIFPNGVPLITAKVQGKKVFDPRTSTTAYSNNAALCIRDFITSSYGLNDSTIDDTSFQAAANECDEDVTLSGSGTEKRYTINGVIRADRSIGDVLQDLTTACAGTLFWGAGSWKLKAGAYSSPVKTLTLDDLRGPIALDTRITMRDNFNTVSGTFIDAEQDYITADYPQLTSATFKAEDGGEEVNLDLPLPYTTSAATAQRLAKLTLFRGREQMTLSADFGLEAFEVEVGDIIAFTNDRYGFNAKEFEVVGWRLAADQDAGDLRINLTLRETSSAAFDWNAEETAIIANNTTLPNFRTVTAPSGLTLTATAVINDDGITIPAIRADWTATDDRFVHHYEVQFKRLGGSEDYGLVNTAYDEQENWGSIASATDEDDEDYGLTNEPVLDADAEFVSAFTTTTSFLIQPVLNGYDYQVKVRAVSALDVRSTFVIATLASQGDTDPPNEPLSLTATAGSKYIELSWTNPADQDLSHIEIWENDSNNLNTATLIGSSGSSNFFRGNLSNNITRYYWARAVDLSLNKSAFTSSVNATTLLITPNDFNDAVNDLFQEAGAFGIEPVNSLPASGDFDGQLVLLLSDITIYRWDDSTSSWSTDIYTASQVEAGSIGFASFAAGIEPVGVVSSLPTVSGYTGPQVVILTTDGKIYRLVSGAWTAAVNTADISGTIGENLFSDDLRPIERVSALPTTDLTQGRVVLLTTDNKLYRYTGNAWTAAVPTTDLTGQIASGQIADAAITATKIGNDAITTAKIATDAITADVIAASAITETKIASNAITTAKINAAAITTAKIAAGAVTADEITAGAITTAKIAAGAVTAAEIAAGAITAGKIAADAVTADKIAANTITASEIAAGAITANEIAANTITAGKIASDTITANEIAANAITASEIAANAVTAGAIAANAVTTAKLAADSVTAGIIAAGAVSTSELAADAVTAEKIAAGAIVADKIAANAITSAKIGTDQVTADKIAAGSIITSKIAAGAVTATRINTNAITADKIEAGAVSADKMTIDGELILGNDAGFIAGRSFNSAYEDDGFFVGRETRADGTQGFELSTSSVNENNELTGIIHNEQDHLKIFNPVLLIGGNVSGGVDTYASTQTVDLGVNTGRTITVTAYGGGGGGGGGHDDRGDNEGGTGAQGGTTTVKIYHTSTSSESNLITTITALGGAGGQSGGGAREAYGTNGGATPFGSGGAGGALNTAGSDAPSTSYGAGGGGGGGDASGLFDRSGAAGLGGSAAVPVIENISITQTTNIYAVITAIGSGGAGDTTGVSYYGGDGAGGAVSISSVFGGTYALPAKEITPMDIWALADVQQRGRANYLVQDTGARATAAIKSNSQDVLWLFDGWSSPVSNGDWWLGGSGRIITQCGYEGQLPNSTNYYLWNERDFIASGTSYYRSSNTVAFTAPCMMYFEAGTWMDTDRSATWTNTRFITEANIPSGYSVEDIARIYLRNLKDYNH